MNNLSNHLESLFRCVETPVDCIGSMWSEIKACTDVQALTEANEFLMQQVRYYESWLEDSPDVIEEIEALLELSDNLLRWREQVALGEQKPVLSTPVSKSLRMRLLTMMSVLYVIFGGVVGGVLSIPMVNEDESNTVISITLEDYEPILSFSPETVESSFEKAWCEDRYQFKPDRRSGMGWPEGDEMTFCELQWNSPPMRMGDKPMPISKGMLPILILLGALSWLAREDIHIDGNWYNWITAIKAVESAQQEIAIWDEEDGPWAYGDHRKSLADLFLDLTSNETCSWDATYGDERGRYQGQICLTPTHLVKRDHPYVQAEECFGKWIHVVNGFINKDHVGQEWNRFWGIKGEVCASVVPDALYWKHRDQFVAFIGTGEAKAFSRDVGSMTTHLGQRIAGMACGWRIEAWIKPAACIPEALVTNDPKVHASAYKAGIPVIFVKDPNVLFISKHQAKARARQAERAGLGVAIQKRECHAPEWWRNL